MEETKRKVSPAKRRANNKYDLEHYTVVGCKIKKKDADNFRQACRIRGTTPNAIFRQAIDDFMRSDYPLEDQDQTAGEI